MKKKTLNILMIVSICLSVALVIFSIFLLSWCLSKLPAKIRVLITIMKYNSPLPYPDNIQQTGFDNLNFLIIFSVVLFVISAFITAILALLFIKSNHEEIKSVAIDFSARRAERKRAKLETEKERLKAKLEELEEESKE